MDDKSKASQVFLSLTGEAEDAVLQLEEEEIYSDQGFTKIIEKLDLLYKKDETLQKYQYMEKFEAYKRTSNMSIMQHIHQFDMLYNKVNKYGTTLSNDLLGFKLLKSANLSQHNEKLAKATGELTYEGMKIQLKKIFTEGSDINNKLEASIKVEDVNYNYNEEETYLNR